MSAIYARELLLPRWTADAGAGELTLERRWIVAVAEGDDETVAVTAEGIPEIGDTYSGARCERVEAAQVGYCLWEVSAEYRRRAASGREWPSDVYEIPFDVPKITLDTWTWDDYPLYDLDGEPRQNTAGDFIVSEKPIRHTEIKFTIVVKRYEYDEAWLSQYAGRVNSQPFRGYPIDQVLCESIHVEPGWQGDTPYYMETAVFLVRNQLWIPTILLSSGMRYRDDNNNLVQADDDNGLKVSGEIALDQDGHKADGPEDAGILHFRDYERADFNQHYQGMELTFRAPEPEEDDEE